MMGINKKNLSILLATILGSSFLLTASWGSDGEAVFPRISHGLTYEECSACHMAYPAGLLPARSWTRMMRELENHFGENASLSPEATRDIAKYLSENAADTPRGTQMMSRIASGIPGNSAPQRFTETRYFGYLHDEVPSYVWKRKGIASKANCVACHKKAEEGSFVEREIKIPKQ